MRANDSRPDRAGLWSRLPLAACVALALQAALPATSSGAQSDLLHLTVAEVSRERVDILVPAYRGPSVGTRLAIERAGRPVAEVEVERVSDLYVTCRVTRLLEPIAEGDEARVLPPLPRVAETPESATAEIRVRQVMGPTVFLDAGRGAGLLVGQRLDVEREGQRIAVLEVEFLSERSASCKLVESSAPLATGDRVIAGPLPPGAGSEPEAVELEEPKPIPSSTPAAGRTRPAPASAWADPSGSVALRYQGFRDDSDAGRDVDQLSAVVNLRLRHLGGSPLELRARLRVGQDRITRSGIAAETRPNDRYYELSLAYAPPQGRYSYHLGRLTAGPEVGFDYLDGILGEFRFAPRWGVGGFYGNRVEVDDLAYDTGGRAYGLFAHFLEESPDRPLYAEAFVSAIGEYRGGEVNREYLSLYGRQGSGSRWSLYERAELDLNRDWRQAGESSTTTQLSNLLVSGSYTVTKAVRFGLTYDERRQVRTLDDRDTPEELFDDALREGLRVNLYLGSGRSVRANLSAGVRRRSGSSEQNETYNASVYYSNLFDWNLLVGADYASFTGDNSEGSRTGLRLQKYFASGYDLELTVGSSTTTLDLLDERRDNEWVRLAGTAQLGHHLFLLGEVEITTGDDLAGQRAFLQLGYRL